MSQFSSAQWPQGNIAYKGNAPINGYPAGPKDSIITLGGVIDENDPQNGTQVVLPFGTFVSANPSTPDLWSQGIASGYRARGLLIVDESIMYNEPFKALGYAVGLPATTMTKGQFRLSSWTHTASGSLVTPDLNSVPIVNTASGFIEFMPSGTSVAPAGFSILTNNAGNNAMAIADVDPLLGATSAGGVLIYLSLY